ncbi:MAG: GH3 auxin-responsive promoter family protein, partial [Bacteroidota bacterium]|nr:GH3 auxin-responsive promoter family protein [Bacteroidota bacterium]
IKQFCLEVDQQLCEQHRYYDDLIKGKVLRTLEITVVQKDGFSRYMKRIGKLGGQNKVPRLTNDRKIADELKKECQ